MNIFLCMMTLVRRNPIVIGQYLSNQAEITSFYAYFIHSQKIYAQLTRLLMVRQVLPRFIS